MELKDKKVIVAGSGKSGIASADLLKKVGAKVTIYDGNDKLNKDDILAKLEDSSDVDVVLKDLSDDLLSETDLMILSPGISTEAEFVVKVKSFDIPVWGEIELAFQVAKGKLVAITGTNGKTTTTALTGEILNAYYKKVDVVGNIGIPYTSTALNTDDETVTVAEISSFQLETVYDFKPDVSAVLNITPDHLDRHHTMENYAAVKMSIAKNQDADSALVLNYDDEMLRELSKDVKNKIVWFSSSQKVENGVYLDGEKIMYAVDGNAEFITNSTDTTLVGIHNTENIMAAIALTINMGVPKEVIREAIMKFKAVAHRIEYVETINDVIYYNDSKGTNTDASIKAIESMSRPTILIAGGYDKGVEFDDYIKAFDGKIKKVIILGQTAKQIADTAKKYNFNDFEIVDDFKTAVDKCHEYAKPGDAVLLSPACASWGMFDNYEQRGDMFKEYVRSYME